VLDHFQIVSLSGTSGGALCASLLWYALQEGDRDPTARLMRFWEANMAQSRAEKMFNRYLVDASRKVTRGEMGAINILNGKLAVYNSRAAPVRNEFIRASCAVPNLFPAVEYDGQAYWDGLFSDNPPIVELTQVAFVGRENLPEELWVIKINQTGCDKIPRTPEHRARLSYSVSRNVGFAAKHAG
jgi:NTE family protein